MPGRSIKENDLRHLRLKPRSPALSGHCPAGGAPHAPFAKLEMLTAERP
jgi:hypothetical protein